MKRWLVGLALAAVLAAGCFPIVLHVDKNGRALIPRPEGIFVLDTRTGDCRLLARPTTGTPVWARWSDDARMVLIALALENRITELVVYDTRSRRTKSVGKYRALACAFWSPEGKAITVGEPDPGGGSCSIAMVNLLNGQKHDLLSRALPMHRWLPGGRLVAFSVTQQHESHDAYYGDVVVVNARTGNLKLVTGAICERSSAIDVTADGKKALLVEWTQAPGFKLSLVDIEAGTKRTLVPQDVISAFWSPDAMHIAYVREVRRKDADKKDKNKDKADADEGDSLIRAGITWFPGQDKKTQLVVADAEGKNEKVVAENVITGTGDVSDQRSVYPSWANDKTILYFASARLYGVGGTSMRLMSVDIDGANRTNCQTGIDAAAAAVAKRPAPRRR